MPLPAPPAHRAKRTVASRLRDARGTSGNAALRTRLALPERVMAKAGSGQKSGKRPRSCAAQPRPSPPGKRRRAPAVAGDAQPPSEGSAAGKSDPKPPTAARHRLCPGRGGASQPVVAPDRASQPVVVDGSRVLASGGASEPVALPDAVRDIGKGDDFESSIMPKAALKASRRSKKEDILEEDEALCDAQAQAQQPHPQLHWAVAESGWRGAAPCRCQWEAYKGPLGAVG